MKKKITVFTFSALLTAGLAMNGCAAKRIDTSEVPQQAPANETAAAPAPAPSVPVQYVVEKHDSLWAISGRSQVYGDPFEWPLIFKANRDQIADPDEISPGQDFSIPKGQTSDEIARARQLAGDTPKFKSHAKPRNPLPIDYF